MSSIGKKAQGGATTAKKTILVDTQLAEDERVLKEAIATCEEAQKNSTMLRSEMRKLMLEKSEELFVLANAKSLLDESVAVMQKEKETAFPIPEDIKNLESIIGVGNTMADVCEQITSVLGTLDAALEETDFDTAETALKNLKSLQETMKAVKACPIQDYPGNLQADK